MATQMHFLIGDYITVCSRIKHESSSSDDEHAAAKPSGASHLPLLSNVSYKKTLRLTSEQLVSVLLFPRLWHWPRTATPARRVCRGPSCPRAPAVLAATFFIAACLLPPATFPFGTPRFRPDGGACPGRSTSLLLGLL